jgi:DNA-binding PucR family transcriptional regulator
VCCGTLTRVTLATGPTARTYELMAMIADRLAADADEIVAAMDAAVIEIVPAVGADAGIAAEVSASNRANLHRFVTVVRHAETPRPGDVPPEALDIARTIVRRGIGIDAIFQGYRRGQQVALERWTGYAAEIVEPGPELVHVIQLSLALLFDYIDETLRRVIAEAQREREEVLGGGLARRTETVRLILDGAPLDISAASQRLSYELARGHTALVVWAEPPGVPHGALESAATLLAATAGAGRPLTLPADTTTLWAWIAGVSEPAPEALRAALENAHPNLRAVVGPTRRGITGFRDSHMAALSLHGLLLGRGGAERLASYDELEVTAIAAADLVRATDFVGRTLGPLAHDNPTAARLRETLRTFLEEAEHAPRAAARLHTHRNTVLQRVARATELLGYDPGRKRLAVELALEISRRLGP